MILIAPILLILAVLNLLGSSNSAKTYTPVSVVVMTRHGARSPLHGKPEDVFSNIVGLGNVTSNGKRMAF